MRDQGTGIQQKCWNNYIKQTAALPTAMPTMETGPWGNFVSLTQPFSSVFVCLLGSRSTQPIFTKFTAKGGTWVTEETINFWWLSDHISPDHVTLGEDKVGLRLWLCGDCHTPHRLCYPAFVGRGMHSTAGLDWPLCRGTGAPLRRTQAPPGPYEIFS